MLFERVARKIDVDVELVEFVWKHYWKTLQEYMSSPVLPQIIIPKFGKIQLSTRKVDQQLRIRRSLFNVEFFSKVRQMSLQLTHNKKYDNDE